MKLSHFQFDLPKELLQNFRLNTEMRGWLLIVEQTIEHKTFKTLSIILTMAMFNFE
jgi:S-adenosylmethionine:tRNA-ribosyltransferase-isomerase (queuine synthetase)